ncbi:Cold-responsive protein kinase 1 [Bienertia sinuspersici]
MFCVWMSSESMLPLVSGVDNIKFYTYKELQLATENFSKVNKIGEGGFGLVYKGRLRDGTAVAVKVLSPESRQGLQEFVTELTVLADIDHENLLCRVLGQNHSSIDFNWRTRKNICNDIARGLAFLHGGVQPHIIHRDIKASNILLDKDLRAKITDFGLAKLIPSNMTHVSTRVAGTLGYLAPEYALRGQLTRKADIYSFGVLLMEIVCGRCNRNRRLPPGHQHLLQRAWRMFEKEALVELVDEAFREDLDIEEASRYLKIALICTQELPKQRPGMSTVVKMLQGEVDVNKRNITQPGILSELDPKEPMDMKNTSSLFSPSSGSSSLPSEQTNVTHATITFTSISARSN